MTQRSFPRYISRETYTKEKGIFFCFLFFFSFIFNNFRITEQLQKIVLGVPVYSLLGFPIIAFYIASCICQNQATDAVYLALTRL